MAKSKANGPPKDISPIREAPILLSAMNSIAREKAKKAKSAFSPRTVAGVLNVRPAVAVALWGNPTASVNFMNQRLSFEKIEAFSDHWIMNNIEHAHATSFGLVQMTEACPPDWLPARGDVVGWRTLRNLGTTLSQLHVFPDTQILEAMPLEAVLDVRRTVSRMLRRTGREGMADWGFDLDFRFHANDVSLELGVDLMSALLRAHEVNPLAQTDIQEVMELGASFLFHPRHPRAIRRVCAAYHARLAPAGWRLGNQERAWESFLTKKKWQAPNGFMVVELLNREALEEEGRLLSHCVGTYAGVCQSGEARIFSVRNPTGERISTLMLTHGIRVGQHSAFNNHAPPPAAVQASQAFLKVIKDDLVSCNPHLIVPRKQGLFIEKSPVQDIVSSYVGNGWETPEIADARWERWRALLDVPADPVQALREHLRVFPLHRMPCGWTCDSIRAEVRHAA